jgi:predicted acyltransferase (DUF342 family)
VTTNFPAQIDSFSLKSPQQIIEAQHVNDLQEATTAIQVFAKSLEEEINNHIAQLVAVHEATAISVDPIVGLDTINLQTSLEDLKTQLDSAILLITSTSAANLAAHVATNISVAHPNGTISGTRIDNNSIDGYKIILGQITESHLSFNIATQVELDAHTALSSFAAHTLLPASIPLSALDTDIATQVELDAHVDLDIALAHPDGYFPISRLDTDVATQSELDAHALTTTDVHGVGADSQVVGTKTIQTLEKKTILSDFEGSKALFWIEEVLDDEKAYFQSSNQSAAQLEIRKKSATLMTSFTSNGQVLPEGYYSYTIDVLPDAIQVFSNILNDSYQLLLYDTVLNNAPIQATIFDVASTTELSILTTFDQSLFLGNATNLLLINDKNAVPLFSVDSTGSVSVKELHVEDSAFTDIEFNDDVTITGNLTVTGETTLQDNTSISGALSVSNTITANNSLDVANTITTNTLATSGGASIGANLVVIGDVEAENADFSQNLNVLGNTNIAGNTVIDGYLSLGQDFSTLGGLNVNHFASFGSTVSIGGELDVALDTTLQSDLEVFGDTNLSQSLFVDGYTQLNSALYVGENLTVAGDAYLNQDAYVSGNLTVLGLIFEGQQSAQLNNNQAAPANIVGMIFDPVTTRSVNINYSIYRYHTGPLIELAAVGTLRLIYKDIANSWSIDDTYAGDNVGIIFTIDPSGQVKYSSSNLPGTLQTSVIKYKYGRLTK